MICDSRNMRKEIELQLTHHLSKSKTCWVRCSVVDVDVGTLPGTFLEQAAAPRFVIEGCAGAELSSCRDDQIKRPRWMRAIRGI